MYKVAFRYNHILVLELWISQELFCIYYFNTFFFFLVSIMMYRQQMPNPQDNAICYPCPNQIFHIILYKTLVGFFLA
jgi:hypothetical protein